MQCRAPHKVSRLAALLFSVLLLVYIRSYLLADRIQGIANTIDLDAFQTWNFNMQSVGVAQLGSENLTITIMSVIERSTTLDYYQHALDSVRCYAQANGYNYVVLNDADFKVECPHQDKFFRRHCVVAHNLNSSDYVLFLDADIGVVNPKRRIEEFIDPKFEITFYDRFYNWEVMAGSYLVKNSEWSRAFLMGFANYEYRIPNSFHGTDNGAIHAYLAEVIYPTKIVELSICMKIYNKSDGFESLFAFEACTRNILGAGTDFGKIQILSKGMGWARDNWLTNSKWNMERDFMMHGWKKNQLRTYTAAELPLSIEEKSRGEWFNPLSGLIYLTMCTSGNTTWNYDENLLTTKEAIKKKLSRFYIEVERDRIISLSRMARYL